MSDLDQCARCGTSRWSHDDVPDGHLFLTGLQDAMRRHPAGKHRDPITTAQEAHKEFGPYHRSNTRLETATLVAMILAMGIIVAILVNVYVGGA
ncbi:hypothetical protein [Tomitella gaofuii]|uniref:hypothetical protein n=1 Tax=Tomitella gaofuii TaxID=2760083 RepID=UPI0015FDDE93|nr:hypothetical protein [Tomitella gaofuii]